jgi:hypothetical protein
MITKARDVIFDESNHIERVMIQSTDDDDLPDLWAKDISTHITPIDARTPTTEWTEDHEHPFTPRDGDVERDAGTEETGRGDETRDQPMKIKDQLMKIKDQPMKNRTMTMNHTHRRLSNVVPG